MKKLIFPLIISFLVLYVFLIDNCKCQWVQCAGTDGLDVYALATVGNTIYSGTKNYPYGSGGVYISTNNGINFTQTALNNKEVTSIVLLGNYIFAGTWNDGIFRSTNNGLSWIQCSNLQYITTLEVCGNSLFAGTSGDGVYLSENYGTSWSKVGITGYYDEIDELTSDGSNIFTSRIGDGIFRSPCNIINWTLITPDDTSNFAWICHNTHIDAIALRGSYIFFGTYGYGVYYSSNYGASWFPTGLNSNSHYIVTLAIMGNNIFAGGADDGCCVYVSTNNGANWVMRIEGLGGGASDVYSLLIINNYIFAGTGNGVYRRPLSELIGIKPIGSEVPGSYSLYQNYPNPFNPTTNIKFDIPKTSDVKLIIYDILGKEINKPVNERLNAGTYQVDWDGSNYPSGVYFYKLSIGEFNETRRMVLIK